MREERRKNVFIVILTNQKKNLKTRKETKNNLFQLAFEI